MFFRGLFKDESGLEFPEYALTAALITAAIVAAIGILGGNLVTAFEGLVDRINS